jgi:myo-inositol-hexaphosphate 3-phosphohydrolase
MNKLSRTLAICLNLLVMPGMAAAAPPAGDMDGAESVPLSADRWLVLDRQALRLLAGDGRELDRLAMRAEHLDSRPTPGGALAVVFDDAHQHPRLVDVDLAADRLVPATSLPEPSFSLERQCLYRDAQRLDHLFLIGKDGRSEQWLLSGPAPRLLRELALPPRVKSCRVDDAHHILYLEEEGLGLWAYSVAGEEVPRRRLLVGAGLREDVAAGPGDKAPHVLPAVQTEPVARRGDAADDPAIWIHPTRPEHSLILATNKKQGLLSYDLAGRTRQLLEVGRLNNVDTRQRVRLRDRTDPVDLAVATLRDENALAVFEIDADGTIRDAGRIATDLDDIYGMCLFQPPTGGLEVFANDKDGRFVHYRVEARDDGYAGTPLRRFGVASQPEGCVVDDRASRLFLGEEKTGIWVMSADSADSLCPDDARRLILPVGPRLTADVEGLALYHGARASYLIASSQGDSSFVVLDAQPPFAFRGAFRIGINAEAGIDAVSETDGLEVTAINLGGRFPDGMLVAQDGFNRLPDAAQNFKLIDWREIAGALGLE